MVNFKDVTVKAIKEEGNMGTYEISPLPRGYGHTLANSLRRILLSSLEGAAVTSVRITGVDHEYSTLEGMKEDVVELLLNLKGVRFNSTSSEPQKCTLKVSGQREVSAADIQVAGGVEVVTPDVHLATLTSKSASLDMEIVVERGVGYRPAEEAHRAEIGRIPVDADFSPVKKVSFDVGSARKGQETDLDSVEISVWTDGSVSAQDALLNSAEILQDFAGKVMAALGVPMREVEQRAEESRQVVEAESSEAVENGVSDEVLQWLIEDLPISKRSKTGLLSGGYEKLGDLREATVGDLMKLSGFGNKSLSEIVELLSQYNIELKSEE